LVSYELSFLGYMTQSKWTGPQDVFRWDRLTFRLVFWEMEKAGAYCPGGDRKVTVFGKRGD